MARSSYIYIAYNHADELLGAWTVRYEMIQYAKDALNCHMDYRIKRAVRVRDGIGAACEIYKADDITIDVQKAIGVYREPKKQKRRVWKKGLPDPYCNFCHGMGYVDKDYSVTHCDCRDNWKPSK